MDQDKRDAAAWAREWKIRQKNRRLLYIIIAVAAVVAVWLAVRFIVIHAERSTFGSEAEMREALQGRYVSEYGYEDIIIEGDEITLTYLTISHYDREYAERYGYEYGYDDSVYEDHIKEWDYRHGVLKTDWMGDIIVDKKGNIREDGSYYFTYYKTDKPRPEPIDPSTLNNVDGDVNAEMSPEELAVIEARAQNLQATWDAFRNAQSDKESTNE